MVGGGALVVGGGSFWGDWGGVCSGVGFQRSYADLTPELPHCAPPPHALSMLADFYDNITRDRCVSH